MDHACKCKHAVSITGNKHCGVLLGILKSVISVQLADRQSVSCQSAPFTIFNFIIFGLHQSDV